MLMDNQEIKISPIRDPSGKPVGWEMQYGNNKGTRPGDYPEIALKKDSGNHHFTITIVDGKGIKFARGTERPKDGDNALWVHEGLTSPKQKMMHDQIKDVRLHNDDQLLFKDKNIGKEYVLSYQLNFTGAPPLDPIIRNGGGNGPGIPLQNYALYGVGALILLAFVGFLVKRSKKSRTSAD